MFPWYYRILGIDLIIGSKMNEIASLRNMLDYTNEVIQQKDE